MSDRPTPLEFLEAVYLNNDLPLSVRMRAAVECAPYVHPKLTAIATATMNGKDFASLLEKAAQRSRAALVVDHQPAEHELPPSAPPGIRGRSSAR